MTQPSNQSIDTRPILAPCRQVPVTAPFQWLKKGFTDFKRVPGLSLMYGLAMMLISVLITYIAYQAHSIVLAIALTAGFFFIGPIIGIGLYSLSRQLNNDVSPQLFRCLRESKKNLGNLMVLSLIFLVVFLVWVRAASMVHIFFPSMSSLDIQGWIKFLAIGSAVGALFSVVIFCIGAFSIPMIMDRNVDTVTAVVTSINAVLKNKLTMLIWGLLIVTLTLIGIATFYVGFVILLPIIGHATWHAYKEVIDADAWELGPGLKDTQ